MSSPFYMVVSSLPRLGGDFKIEQVPISRMQLEKRLKLLPEVHSSLLFSIEHVLWKSWFEYENTVAALRQAWIKLSHTDSVFLHELMDWYLDFRSIIAALRLRHRQKEVPEQVDDLWITRWSHKIVQHWSEPDFGLKSVYPWLPELALDVAKEDTLRVEAFFLKHFWTYLLQKESEHSFDFEALVIYLLRWNIVDYWSGFGKENILAHLGALFNKDISHERH